MAPRKAPVNRGNPDSSSVDISQMISDQIAAAMPNVISQISTGVLQNMRDSNIEGAGGSGTRNDKPNGCSYKEFMGCKPLDFKGTEGAVGILRWIEKTESVLNVSDCADDCKVKYATCTFQGRALTWWNTEVRTRGRAEIDTMTWEQLKEILIKEYCPDNEIQRIESELWTLEMKGSNIQGYNNRFHELSQLVPHLVTPESKRINRYMHGLVPQIRGMVKSSKPTTLQSAMVLAGSLTDDAVCDGVLPKFESRRESRNKREGGGGGRTSSL